MSYRQCAGGGDPAGLRRSIGWAYEGTLVLLEKADRLEAEV
jgi:hypothetical protein